MKIAVISMIREPWGGSEELWADMATEALHLKHTVIHSSFKFRAIAAKENELIKRGLLHIPRRGFIKKGIAIPIRIISKLLTRFFNFFNNPYEPVFRQNPDFILYNGTCYSIVNEKYLLLALKRYGTAFSILGHYNQEDGKEITDAQAARIKEIYSRARHVFFVSLRSLHNAEKRTGAKILNAKLVRNPVNMPSLEIVPYPNTGQTQFAMVGNLRVVHKGQDKVLEILAKEKWRNRDWHLNIYGLGEDELMLRELAKDLGIQNLVSFHGKVNNIRKLWENNHILLMPSLMEGMPLAVVEAMICGRPSVVTDVGGHREWIEEEKEGWIAHSLSEFEQSLEKAWNQRTDWEQTGKNAHKKAIRLFDPEPGKTLLDIIRNAIQDGPLQKDN